jgi:hypothetical protein
LQKRAFAALAGDDDRTVFAPFVNQDPGVESQFGFLFEPAVTGVTTLFEKRLDFAFVVRRSRREGNGENRQERKDERRQTTINVSAFMALLGGTHPASKMKGAGQVKPDCKNGRYCINPFSDLSDPSHPSGVKRTAIPRDPAVAGFVAAKHLRGHFHSGRFGAAGLFFAPDLLPIRPQGHPFPGADRAKQNRCEDEETEKFVFHRPISRSCRLAYCADEIRPKMEVENG